jgi:hypothetical protein
MVGADEIDHVLDVLGHSSAIGRKFAADGSS